MIKTMEFHGRTVVAPVLAGGRELVEAPETYFVNFIRAWWAGNIAEKPVWVNDDDPEPFIEWWFEQEMETLWQVVLKYFDWKCHITGEETNTCHEIITRGAASSVRALVPWGMIPVSAERHKLIHDEQGNNVWNYDPFDSVDGFIICDTTNHRIPNDKLWFYNRPSFDEANNANARRRMVLDWARNRIAADWAIAPVLAKMRLEKDYKVFGEPSHKSMLSGMQHDLEANPETGAPADRHFYLDTGLCNSLERAVELAVDNECVEQAMYLAPPKAVRIMKRIEDRKEMIDFMVQVSYLSLMDFNKLWKELYAKQGEEKEEHRDAIEAVCECGNAHLRVHRHIIDGVDDQFGFDADYTVDNGEPVHTSKAVEVVIDKGDANESNKEEDSV